MKKIYFYIFVIFFVSCKTTQKKTVSNQDETLFCKSLTPRGCFTIKGTAISYMGLFTGTEIDSDDNKEKYAISKSHMNFKILKKNAICILNALVNLQFVH